MVLSPRPVCPPPAREVHPLADPPPYRPAKGHLAGDGPPRGGRQPSQKASASSEGRALQSAHGASWITMIQYPGSVPTGPGGAPPSAASRGVAGPQVYGWVAGGNSFRADTIGTVGAAMRRTSGRLGLRRSRPRRTRTPVQHSAGASARAGSAMASDWCMSDLRSRLTCPFDLAPP